MGHTERLRWLDGVKGLAIVLVVWGHIALDAQAARVFVYSFHLPVFFVVMGILRAWRDPHGECWRFSHRAVQLLYPYVTFSLIIVLYLVCLGRRGDAEAALAQTLCLDGYNTLWFLPACLLAECVFVLLPGAVCPTGGAAWRWCWARAPCRWCSTSCSTAPFWRCAWPERSSTASTARR